jgi:hypothetical protein
MAFEDGGMGTTMLVSPNNGGFGGGFGSDWGWIILLLLCCGGGFGGFGGAGGFYDFPWLMNGQQNISNQTANGFRDAALSDGITAVNGGIAGLANQLCNTGNGIQMAMANGFAGVEQGANARQMADMQQMFGIQSSLQNCCCENRANIADLKYTVAQENCADRQALNEGVRDIIASQTAGIQSIKDQMCADKIEQKNDIIAQLRSELMFARGQASQDVQTAAIQASQRMLANEVEQYVAPLPRPAYIVANPTTPVVTL